MGNPNFFLFVMARGRDKYGQPSWVDSTCCLTRFAANRIYHDTSCSAQLHPEPNVTHLLSRTTPFPLLEYAFANDVPHLEA